MHIHNLCILVLYTYVHVAQLLWMPLMLARILVWSDSPFERQPDRNEVIGHHCPPHYTDRAWHWLANQISESALSLEQHLPTAPSNSDPFFSEDCLLPHRNAASRPALFTFTVMNLRLPIPRTIALFSPRKLEYLAGRNLPRATCSCTQTRQRGSIRAYYSYTHILIKFCRVLVTEP